MMALRDPVKTDAPDLHQAVVAQAGNQQVSVNLIPPYGILRTIRDASSSVKAFWAVHIVLTALQAKNFHNSYPSGP